MQPKTPRLVIAIIVTLLLFLGRSLIFRGKSDTVRDLRRAFVRGDHAAVIEAADELLNDERLTPDLAMKAGESATRLSRLSLAEGFYSHVPPESSKYVTASVALGEIYRETGKISAAIKAYSKAVETSPDHVLAHSRLALLFMSAGLHHHAKVHLHQLLELKAITTAELCWLAAPHLGMNLRVDKPQSLIVNDDPIDTYGRADALFRQGAFEECSDLLTEITDASIADERDILKFKCRLRTEALPELPTDLLDRFERYSETRHADGLFVLGQLLARHAFASEASTCAAAAIKTELSHVGAFQFLAVAANGILPDEEVLLLRNWAALLSELDTVLKSVNPERISGRAAERIASLMQTLGRSNEAVAWCLLAKCNDPPNSASNLKGQVLDVAAVFVERLPEQLHLRSVAAPQLPGTAATSTATSQLIFEDRADDVGLAFRYFESPDVTTDGRRMIEFTGGGVGVVDLDGDTWPDLHFTQGCEWPREKEGTIHDAVLMNQRGLHFRDVTHSCGILEFNFSQGVACGDINNDGFADIVVANIGNNSLWLNQGDGTFVPAPLPTDDAESDVWTTGCAIADLNLDGDPDIIGINYVGGHNFDSLICPTPAGPRVCTPTAFTPLADQLCLSRGDGTFESMAFSRHPRDRANGLGLIVGNLDGDAMPEIFVANDAMPNQLWDNTAPAGAPPEFVDVAVPRGVAYGADGSAQACMGISTADFDRSGTTDLFVTNFYGESNAMYQFDEQGSAYDASMRCGIEQVSLSMLGFGTQSLDPNADGLPDVFVANGDLDDFTHEERMFRMPLQVLINSSEGVFKEEQATAVNDIRHQLTRGRGVARFDWNRNQQWDLAVSCLDDNAMLVVLKDISSDSVCHFRCIGRIQSRDAIGVEVRDESGRLFQDTAGDGYMATNQKGHMLRTKGRKNVRWPSRFDHQQEVQLSEATTQILIEGRSRTYSIPH